MKGIFVQLEYGFVRLPEVGLEQLNEAVCVYKLQKKGRTRCTLYTKCTTPRPLTDVHQAVENNLQ